MEVRPSDSHVALIAEIARLRGLLEQIGEALNAVTEHRASFRLLEAALREIDALAAQAGQ